MTELPEPVMKHIRRVCVEAHHPAFLFVGKGGLLGTTGGDFEHYGLEGLHEGVAAADRVDFIQGLLPLTGDPLYLPFLQTPSRQYVDLHLFPGDGGDWVLLIDVTRDAERLSLVQQTSHDLELLREKQTRMLAAIQRSHDDLLSIFNHLQLITAIVNGQGRVEFLSQAGERFFERPVAAWREREWEHVLAFDLEAQLAIRRLFSLPQSERRRERLSTHIAGSRACTVEVEVQDDPRDAASRMVFLYDVSELHELRELLEEKALFEGMVGRSRAMQELFQLIRDVARVDSTVLVEGETGTGKELVARAIHQVSPRRNGPLVIVNVAGLSDSLINSQLFGHKKGSFTDAVRDQEGVFEAANGGTIFLDEIGDIPMNTQTRILRALEQREVVRIGETQSRVVDIRILAATNKNLEEEVRAGRFRMDLLYRIRVARVLIPPLRERRDDIPLLLESFLARARAITGKRIETVGAEALRLMMDHPWPGNVRELKNAVEFAVIRCHGAELRAEDLPPEILQGVRSPQAAQEQQRDTERDQILKALETAQGRRAEAAKLLGISRATLYRRMQACLLTPSDLRRQRGRSSVRS